jgi:glycosyltransferase involved in cell wall biosynthesis
MDPLRVILISSVRPEPGGGSEVVLYRHLCASDQIKLESYSNGLSAQDGAFSWTRLKRAGARRLFGRWYEDWKVLRKGRELVSRLPPLDRGKEATVVVTLAHGDGFQAAMQYARENRLPLVSIFHDWWPDVPRLHPFARSKLVEAFAALYRESTVNLCVSPGMRDALGPHPDARVLYPIPASHPSLPAVNRSVLLGPSLKLAYAGNLFEYGPMIGELLQALRSNEEIRLQVRGKKPRWPAALREEAQRAGWWLDFAPREAFDAWLASVDACLVTMSFAPELKRRMETSFPSKLCEYAQFGRPIVVWGPSYCSAVKWAREGNRALWVEDPSPRAVIDALQQLRSSPGERKRLAESACTAAQTEFSPDRIQAQFVGALTAAVYAAEPSCQD